MFRTNPCTASRCWRNGLVRTRWIDFRTEASRSSKPSSGEGERYPGTAVEIGLHLLLRELVGAAAGVVDQHDLLRPQEALGQDQRPDDVVGDDAAHVAEDVGVAPLQPEDLHRVDPGIHTGDDGEAQPRGARES